MAERIQLSRRAGFKLGPHQRSVARPHYFGNPYTAGDVYLVGSGLPFPVPSARTWEGPCGAGDTDLRAVRCPDAATAVEWFRAWARLALEPDKIEWLRGKDLACWCKPGDPCHADVLLEIANAPAASSASPEGNTDGH